MAFFDAHPIGPEKINPSALDCSGSLCSSWKSAQLPFTSKMKDLKRINKYQKGGSWIDYSNSGTGIVRGHFGRLTPNRWFGFHMIPREHGYLPGSNTWTTGSNEALVVDRLLAHEVEELIFIQSIVFLSNRTMQMVIEGKPGNQVPELASLSTL